MKLILITLVALVVGTVVACSSEPPTPAAPTATPAPAFSDAEVLGAVRGHLRTTVANPDKCRYWERAPQENWTLRRDVSNPDKYLVTAFVLSGGKKIPASWTFYLGNVISTSPSNTLAGHRGC